jgi:hypothetical protein
MVNDICSAEQRANRRALQQRTHHRDESGVTSVIGSQNRIGYSTVPASLDVDGEGVEEAEGEGLTSQVPTFQAVRLMPEGKQMRVDATIRGTCRQ